MSWVQKEIQLRPRRRGFHLITEEVLQQLPELRAFEIGIAHIFILHTSASITVNESADPEVRDDFEDHFNEMVPENAPYFRHVYEGEDDMPAHIKAALLGSSVTVPVAKGKLKLGTWQGLYLCEHRNEGGARRLIITVHGP